MEWLRSIDESWFRAIHERWHRDWLDPVFWVVSSSGLGWVQPALIVLFGFLLRSGNSFKESLRRNFGAWGWPLLLSYALSGSLNTFLIKRLIERDRPSNLAWAHPQETAYFGSFPSGHTATSFGIAVMALFLTRGTRLAWLGWLSIFWACMVGVSRVYRGVHWPTDVLGGALCGMVGASLAILILRLLSRKPSDVAEKDIEPS